MAYSTIPAQTGDAGGDVHYVSVCPSCIVSRIALADVSGHGQGVVSLARRPLIAQSQVEESTFIYGPDLPAQLQSKVAVMRRHLPDVDRFFARRR